MRSRQSVYPRERRFAPLQTPTASTARRPLAVRASLQLIGAETIVKFFQKIIQIRRHSLGHVYFGKVEAKYQPDDLLAERRELLDAWSLHCSGATAEVQRLRA